ncbi:MAG: PEGA domain-containing protein [bacterium]|nr:PEGA domain-containing protein [bacterium]
MLKGIVFWIVMVAVFVFLSGFILISACGYKVNWLNFSVRPTALILLRGDEKNVEIYIDNKKVGDDLPYRIGFVEVGWKELKIKKNGYHDWKKSFYAEASEAYEFRDIVFFKKDTSPQVVKDMSLKKSLEDVVLPMNINAVNGEMTANDSLVTRFFTDPVSYQWWDGKHILFQIENKIRVIDLSGQNDIELVSLTGAEPSVFKVINNGKSLLYTDGNRVKQVEIR